MNDFIHRIGVGTLVVAGIAVTVAVACLVVWLIGKVWPQHWALAGPMRKSADVRRIFRNVNARGRHVSSYRRLLSLGPWTIYAARCRPGNVEQED